VGNGAERDPRQLVALWNLLTNIVELTWVPIIKFFLFAFEEIIPAMKAVWESI
jgi:hypothetical protein